MKDSLEVNVNCKKVGNLVLEDNEYICSYVGNDKNDYISLPVLDLLLKRVTCHLKKAMFCMMSV